jgi:cysteine desulfurase
LDNKKFIYADNAATTKVSDAAISAMLPLLRESFGNPSSIHVAGQAAAKSIVKSRETIARLLGCNPKEIYFTSGGSESDNQGLVTMADAGKKLGKNHIISTAIEHHAVLNMLDKLKEDGFRVTLIKPNSHGYISPKDIENAIDDDTIGVSVMYANNEVGTVQPIAELAEICKEHGVYFHTDAVQAAGHINIDLKELDVSMLSFSAHKFHGPKGVGLLYVKKGIYPAKIMLGGAQERGRRAGTENVAAIAGMAAALNEQIENIDKNATKISSMRNRLERKLLNIQGSIANGAGENRLPGTCNISFKGINGEELLMMLSEKGICVSSGAACSSGSLEPSHVLIAMGRSKEEASSALRFSLSEYNTEEEIDCIAETVEMLVKLLRGGK